LIGCYTAQQYGAVEEEHETLAATADFTVEIGPGRPLRGFFKTMGVECQSVTNLSGARKVFEKGTRSQKPS
jgi:hypothetical protein